MQVKSLNADNVAVDRAVQAYGLSVVIADKRRRVVWNPRIADSKVDQDKYDEQFLAQIRELRDLTLSLLSQIETRKSALAKQHHLQLSELEHNYNVQTILHELKSDDYNWIHRLFRTRRFQEVHEQERAVREAKGALCQARSTYEDVEGRLDDLTTALTKMLMKLPVSRRDKTALISITWHTAERLTDYTLLEYLLVTESNTVTWKDLAYYARVPAPQVDDVEAARVLYMRDEDNILGPRVSVSSPGL